jgi:hypothetical protein
MDMMNSQSHTQPTWNQGNLVSSLTSMTARVSLFVGLHFSSPPVNITFGPVLVDTTREEADQFCPVASKRFEFVPCDNH